MEGYLGETELDWKQEKEFAKFTKKDWALLYITKYGWIDGGHHKDWVLDQVARILNGAPISLRMAKWNNGQSEYRFSVGESEQYHKWVKDISSDENGNIISTYEVGIAP